jgi:hypothetical protein
VAGDGALVRHQHRRHAQGGTVVLGEAWVPALRHKGADQQAPAARSRGGLRERSAHVPVLLQPLAHLLLTEARGVAGVSVGSSDRRRRGRSRGSVGGTLSSSAAGTRRQASALGARRGAAL